MPPKERSTVSPQQADLQYRLAAARKASGLSQEQIARELGVSRQTLAAVEKGQMEGTKALITGIAAALIALGAVVIVKDVLKINSLDDLARRLFGSNERKGGSGQDE